MTKHIFVTGGVASSLGKGLTASSLGRGTRTYTVAVEPRTCCHFAHPRGIRPSMRRPVKGAR